jgi:ankyrin repeat protein
MMDLRTACRNGDLEVIRKYKDAGSEISVSSGRTLLFEATRFNEVEVVKLLLEYGADVNQPNFDDPDTPLSASIHNSNLEITKLFYENDPKIVEHQIRWSNTCVDPLYLATYHQCLEIVRFLIEKGAVVNKHCGFQWSPLHIAVEHGDIEITQFLVEKGADINADKGTLRNPLYTAVRKGLLNIARFLLENGGDVHMITATRSLLYVAVSNTDLKMSRLLIEFGFDVKKYENGWKQNSVMFTAVKQNALGISKILLMNGIDINETNELNYTVLYLAFLHRQVKMAKMIIRYGKDLKLNYHQDRQQCWTYLEAAISIQELSLVELLIEKGADVNSVGESKSSALHTAVKFPSEKIVSLLLEHGADVNKLDQYGRTPLLSMVKTFSSKIVKLLLDKGADINACDNKGWTMLCLACGSRSSYYIAYFLLDNGADPNLGPDGRSPLSIFIKNGEYETSKLILERGAIITEDAVQRAVSNYDFEIIRMLVDHDVDLKMLRSYFDPKKDANSAKIEDDKLIVGLFDVLTRGWMPNTHKLFSSSKRQKIEILIKLYYKSWISKIPRPLVNAICNRFSLL